MNLTEDRMKEYVSQARATLTSKLGLSTDDDRYDEMIEEELMNMIMTIHEYETGKDGK